MTALAGSPREADKARVIDVRCAAVLPRSGAHDGRCQLFAGHDGPHAMMYAQGGQRVVRTWRGAERTSRLIDCQAIQHLPWMYGFPVPAWFETEAEAVN